MSPETRQPEILTISQLTRRIKDLLESEISHVWVSGEISNWRVSPNGHAYFTLKDESTQLPCVVFHGRMSRLQFTPDNGLQVIVHGQVTVYEQRGTYQLICDEMHPKGLGMLQLRFEKLKQKLAAEGLFAEEHKKPLPLFPRRIGVVTSPSGAAIRDILNVINRRFASLHVLLFPARVQGDEAAEEIVEGIRVLDGLGVDVMIVGRGGGSMEDLWPFNEEIVVRAIHAARTPVISAVGHEIDITLADFVADVRAATPSVAAELVVQEQAALADKVAALRERLVKSVGWRIQSARNRLALAISRGPIRQPEDLVRQRRQRVDELRMRVDSAVNGRVTAQRHKWEQAARAMQLLSPSARVSRAKERLMALRLNLKQGSRTVSMRLRSKLQPLAAQLDALSPLGVLARGYALAKRLPDGTLVRDAAQLSPGDRLQIRFMKGSATALVETTEEDADA